MRHRAAAGPRREASKFAEPIFTPRHQGRTRCACDENISFAEVVELVGAVRADQLRAHLQTYIQAADHALSRGVIIADTKFEFGVDADGTMVLADEVFTPDSSRVLEYGHLPARCRAGQFRQAVRPAGSRHPVGLGPQRPETAAAVAGGHRRRHRARLASEAYERISGLRFADWIGPTR